MIGEARVREAFQGPPRYHGEDLGISSGTRRVTSNVMRKSFDSIQSHAQTALSKSRNEMIKRTEDSGSGVAAPAITMSKDDGYSKIAESRRKIFLNAPHSNLPLKGGFNDLDTKNIASHEGYATVVSSLNPTDAGGAAEQLAEFLWNSVEIQRCVKLGFVVMDSDQFERNFLYLIKSFASELRAEANTIIRKGDRAHFDKVDFVRIIRKTSAFDGIEEQIATKLAQERLLEQQRSTRPSDQSDIRPEDKQDSNGQESNRTIHPGNDNPYLLRPDKFKEFLILSTAFKDFKAQLEIFIESYSRLQQIMEGLPSQSHIGNLDEHVLTEHLKKPGFLRQAKNILQKSRRPAIPPGSKRVEWICVRLPSNSFW